MSQKIISEISKTLLTQLTLIVVAVPLIVGLIIPGLLKELDQKKVVFLSFWVSAEQDSD